MLISRRAVLKGVGASIALPWFESLRAMAAPSGDPPMRMAFVVFPNGVQMPEWTPAQVGALGELPATLKPLDKLKKRFLVLSGLTCDGARAHGDGPGDHARASAAFLTGAHPVKTSGKGIRVGVSVDQFAAEHAGQSTKLPSLELGCERGAQAGDCDSGYSCAYTNNISWRTPTSPVTKETNPRAAFQRMFGNVNEARDAAQAARDRRSVLDVVREEARSLAGKLGSEDRSKLQEYTDAVRSIEKRIQAAEQENAARVPPGRIPDAAPASFQEHIRMMMDLTVLALQTDTTRIVTLQLANEGSNRPFPFLGVNEGHHHISHHGRNKEKQAKIRLIDRFYLEQYGYLLEKLAGVKEGSKSLLDRCMTLYGCGIGDGDRHNHDNLPILLGGGPFAGGRHLRYPKETPLCDLYVTMLQAMGVKAEKFGDSRGRLTDLG
jgi:hypothetical protein